MESYESMTAVTAGEDFPAATIAAAALESRTIH